MISLLGYLLMSWYILTIIHSNDKIHNSLMADEGDPKHFGAQNFIFSKSSIGTLDAKSTSCTLVNVEHFFIFGFF